VIPRKGSGTGKTVLVDDALVADITDRMERLIHALSMTVRAGGLPRPAVQALVNARIGIVSVLAKLNSALVEAEQAEIDE